MNAWLDHNIYTLWKGFVSQFRILSSSVFLPLEGSSTKNANTDLDQKWSLRCVSRLSALTDSGLKSKLHPFLYNKQQMLLDFRRRQMGLLPQDRGLEPQNLRSQEQLLQYPNFQFLGAYTCIKSQWHGRQYQTTAK